MGRYGEALERFQDLDGYALEARASEVLAGLSFSPERMGGDVGLVSGGWKMRVAPSEMAAVRTRLRLYLETVQAVLGAGVLGVALYRGIGSAVSWIAATLLAAFSLRGLAEARPSTVKRADLPWATIFDAEFI